jgi:hypothetical protein
MGSGSSKSIGTKAGHWFNGKPVYSKDLPSLNNGIAAGRYRRVDASTDLPANHELAFVLYQDGEQVRYVAPMRGFKAWWIKHRANVIEAAVAASGLNSSKATEIVNIALPILLDSGKDAAKQAVIQECGDGMASAGSAVIDILSASMGAQHITGSPLYSAATPKVGSFEFLDGLDAGSYIGAAEHVMALIPSISAGYAGGCDCGERPVFIGADEMDLTTIKDYANSINSKVKTTLIDDIIAVGTRLNLKITGTTQGEKIKSMLSLLPSGDKLKSDDATQRRLCVGLADAINKSHGTTVINTSLPAGVICQNVAEVISSLASGMHTEFLAVYNDVRRILKNLHVLKNAIADDHTAIMDKINKSSDSLLQSNVTSLTDLHNMLTEEIDRQIQMLSNLLNISLVPAEKELAALIKSKKDIHGYIDKIDVKTGSQRFSKVIADILKGLGITANFALLIEKALKTVGMTVNEYANSESVQKLREKVASGIMGKTMDDSALHEYLEAAELLYKNFYRSQDIAKTIETKTGQGEMMSAYDDQYTGGDDVYRKTVMDKRIADREKVRNLIFNTFYRQINALFDSFVGSLDVLTMKVGSEIPLSEQLNSFRHVLQRIDEGLVRNKNIYYALIGYYNDAMSRSKKEALIAELKMVSSYIDTLVEMPLYGASKHYFTAVQGHIRALLDIIDKFSDEIAAKFGRGDSDDCPYLEEKGRPGDNIAHDDEAPVRGAVRGAYDFPDAVFGGDGIAAKPHLTYKNAKTIHDAIRQFDYKYRVAQIHVNLGATSKELAHYGEKYEKIIANSIADVLNEDKKVYEKLRQHLTDKDYFGDNSQYIVSTAEGFEQDKFEKERAAAVKFLENQWEVKKKFWATIEAVDSYMKVFTDALVKNPNDVREIKSMLDEIAVINDWYNDKTGSTMVRVFENFPSNLKAMGDGISTDVEYPPEKYQKIGEDDDHYYAKIGEEQKYPGNPYLVTMPTRGEAARATAKKMFSGLGILKNLLSVFVHVGARFGGEEIRKKVFMTPTQMYNNLVDYLTASAFAQGFGVGKLTGLESGELPPEFYSSANMSVQVNLVNGAYNAGSPKATPWAGGATTYSSPGMINLGVTANATVSAIDHHYTKSSIAPLLVDKINDATDEFIRVMTTRAPGMGVNDTPNTTKMPARGTVNPGTDLVPNLAGPATQKWEFSLAASQRALLFKKRWGVWMRSCLEGLKAQEGFSFKREDDYFVLVMKALAAKILTVTGTYDVFDRPYEFNGLSPIRMIMGGDVSTPKVEEAAVPLYLRLPLLAQFYRKIFDFDETEADSNNKFRQYDNWRANDKMIKISMVPDVDGIFAGLIRIVFRKNKYLTEFQYSDDDMKELIREINLIYQRMVTKYPTNTVMETIHEFVAEVNRRYGVISKTEHDQYEREFGYQYNYARNEGDKQVIDRYTQAPDTESVAILPGEGDDEIERPSAAQRLLGSTFESSTAKKSPFTINPEHKDLVYRFRCAIDKFFENPSEEYTFSNAIKAAQLKLRAETNDENRFKIVATLMRGTDVYSKIDGMKYVLFHETVVAGLNVLSAAHSMLARFKRRVHVIDISNMEKLIWDWLSEVKSPKIEKDLHDHIITHLCDKMGLADKFDANIVNLVHKLFGLYEAAEWNGGHTIKHATIDKFALKGGADVPIGSAGTGKSLHVRRFPAPDTSTFSAIKDDGKSHGVKNGRKDAVFLSTQVAIAADPRGAPQGGLVSVLAGFVVEDLKKAYYAAETPQNRDAKRAAETFMRFIFSREFVMKELLESVFGISSDFQNLVTFHIENGRLQLNYGGLKSLIEETFQSVSYFMDLLRPHIKPDLMLQYSEKTTPGSYYWLQEQLMEKIIIGRPAQTVPFEGESNLRPGYASLEELSQKLSYTYSWLTREWSVDGKNLAAAHDAVHNKISEVNPIPKGHANRFNNYDKVFAQMIFYDGTRPGSGLIHSAETWESANVDLTTYEALNGVKLVDYMHSPYDGLHFSNTTGTPIIDTRYITRFHQLYSWKDEFTLNRSALFSFNQLIAKFIQAFYDPVSNKIYAGLLNQFANGSFNRAVADQTYTYPDTVPAWFIKTSDTSSSPIPNDVIVSSGTIEPSIRGFQSLLTSLITQYLTYGIKPTDVNQRSRRTNLLNKTNAEVVTPITGLLIAGATVNNTPAIYVYLLVHALSDMIHDTFGALEILGAQHDSTVADGKIAAYTKEVNQFIGLASATDISVTAALAVPGPPMGGITEPKDFGAARKLYGSTDDINPTKAQILAKLLGGSIDDIVARLNAAVGDWSKLDKGDTGFQIPATGSPMAAITGEVGKDPLDVFENFPNYKGLFNRVLNRPGTGAPDTVNVNWAQILEVALRIFPKSDDALGRNDDERAYNTELFSSIVLRLASDWYTVDIGATAAKRNSAFRDAVKSVISDVTSSRSTYAVSPTTQPKFTAKYDDIALANIGLLQEASVRMPMGDTAFLMLARGSAVGRALDSNNMEGLRGPKTSPNPAMDTLAALTNFGRRADPDAEHILFTSLSVILKNLVTNRANSQALLHIQDNVADIPLYMKEKMRANLPAFRNLFKELIVRCEFIKRMLGQNSMHVARVFDAAGTNYTTGYTLVGVPKHNPWPYILASPADASGTMSSDRTKSHFTGILDSIIRGSVSLVSSCEQVLREIGDDPKYLETYQGSIKDYKTQYGVDPLMPLSSSLAVLKNVISGTEADNKMAFFPVHSLGEESFKLMYAVRSLLGQPSAAPLLEHAPGFSDTINSFNLMIEGKLQADKGRAETFFKGFVKILRYIFELKHIKGLLTPYIFNEATWRDLLHPNGFDLRSAASPATLLHIDGMFTRDDLVLVSAVRGDPAIPRSDPHDKSDIYGIASDPTVNTAAAPTQLTNRSTTSLAIDNMNDKRRAVSVAACPLPVFAIAKPLADVLRITESSFRDDQIKELVEYLCNKSTNANSLEIQNIIDLNIVPINVHALMREIPLINLYNYAYTFDRLIIELYYGLQNKNAQKLIAELCDGSNNLKRITSAKDMLVALLLDPYMDLFRQGYDPEEKNITPVTVSHYEKFVKPMLAGVPMNGELGRPKFLSDQIFNKAVFGELYMSPDEYNEMGPAAGTVYRVNVDQNQRIGLITHIASISLQQMNTDGRFEKLIFKAEATDPRALVAAVVRYVAQNPSVHLSHLWKLIYDNFLNGDNKVPLFVNMTKDNEGSRRLLAIMVGLVVKLVYHPITKFVNEVNKQGIVTPAIISALANFITIMLTPLNAIGAIAPDPKTTDGDYLGLALGAGGAPTNDWDALVRMSNAMQPGSDGPINPGTQLTFLHNLDAGHAVFNIAGLHADTTNYGRAEDIKLIHPILKEVVIKEKWPVLGLDPTKPVILVPATGIQAIITAEANVWTRTSAKLTEQPSRQSGNISRNSLHWLAPNPTKVETPEPGVSLQPEIYGDNINVLDSDQIKSVSIESDLRQILVQCGRLRFDTIFIRNLIFIVNLYRSVRMKLQRDLTYSKDIVLRSAPITRSNLTEFFSNEVDHNRVPYQTSDMWKRYNH